MMSFEQDWKELTDSWADETVLSSLLVIFLMHFLLFPNKSIPVPSDLFSNSVDCGSLLWVELC